jgi:hypothetical protein
MYFGKVSYYDDDAMNVQCHGDLLKNSPLFSSKNWDADPSLYDDMSAWVRANGRVSDTGECERGEMKSPASEKCGNTLCVPVLGNNPELEALVKRVKALPSVN